MKGTKKEDINVSLSISGVMNENREMRIEGDLLK